MNAQSAREDKLIDLIPTMENVAYESEFWETQGTEDGGLWEQLVAAAGGADIFLNAARLADEEAGRRGIQVPAWDAAELLDSTISSILGTRRIRIVSPASC